MESDRWACVHVQYRMIESWSAPYEEGHSSAECVGDCKTHPLLFGDAMLCEVADRMGKSWGDLAEEHGWFPEGNGPSLDDMLLAAKAENTHMLASIAALKVKRIASATRSEKMYDRRTGKPMPCRNFCYKGIVGNPEPATEIFPEGCRGHMEGSACAISKDGVARLFFHPGQEEWKIITGEIPFVRAAPVVVAWADQIAQMRTSGVETPSQSRPHCTNPVCTGSGKAHTHATEKCGMPGGAAYRARR